MQHDALDQRTDVIDGLSAVGTARQRRAKPGQTAVNVAHLRVEQGRDVLRLTASLASDALRPASSAVNSMVDTFLETIRNIPRADAEANYYASLETEAMAAELASIRLRQTRRGSTELNALHRDGQVR